MKIKLDENLPVRLSTLLKELGHDVDTVHDEQRIGHPDSKIWSGPENVAISEHSGLGLSVTRRFELGSHHGILLLRVHSPSRRNPTEGLVELLLSENPGEWAGWFVVATEQKIRILKPRNLRES